MIPLLQTLPFPQSRFRGEDEAMDSYQSGSVVRLRPASRATPRVVCSDSNSIRFRRPDEFRQFPDDSYYDLVIASGFSSQGTYCRHDLRLTPVRPF